MRRGRRSPCVVAHLPRSSLDCTDTSQHTSRVVLDASDISRALTRIAHEILERNKGADDLILLGIPSTRCAARRTGSPPRCAEVEGVERPQPGRSTSRCTATTCGCGPARALEHTDIPARGIDGAVVVLVDDVLYSGRTIRAALDALNDVGRPRAVQLAVLVDRGHRELPIRADFVGKNLPTSLFERVQVTLSDFDRPRRPGEHGVQDTVVITSPTDPPRRTTGVPHEAPSALQRRPHPRRRAPHPRHRRRAALARRPADQEAPHPARPHRGQPLLRGLDPHPDLVRGGRQAALAPT